MLDKIERQLEILRLQKSLLEFINEIPEDMRLEVVPPIAREFVPPKRSDNIPILLARISVGMPLGARRLPRDLEAQKEKLYKDFILLSDAELRVVRDELRSSRPTLFELYARVHQCLLT